MSASDRLSEIAEAIADGRPVDWDRLFAEALDPATRQLLQQLAVLHRVGEVRLAPLDPGDDDRRALAMDPDPFPGGLPARWGPLLVIARLGAGAHGEVFRAVDPRLDRPVALKLLRPAAVARAGTEAETTTVREARLLAKVEHPNVVRVFGAEEIDGRVGFWMELLSGPTLEEELERRGAFPPDRVLAVARDVASALAAIHAAGLLYRDLKTQNVLLHTDGRPRLTDFGTVTEGSIGPELNGTPLYLAPEILAGRSATVQSDVYAFGVLLYRLLTGTFPVEGRTVDALRAAHDEGTPRRSLPARVPRPLAKLVQACLQQDPGRRPRTAADVERSLRPGRSAASRWTLAALAIVGSLVLLLALPGFRSAFGSASGAPSADHQPTALYFARAPFDAATTERTLVDFEGLVGRDPYPQNYPFGIGYHSVSPAGVDLGDLRIVGEDSMVAGTFFTDAYILGPDTDSGAYSLNGTFDLVGGRHRTTIYLPKGSQAFGADLGLRAASSGRILATIVHTDSTTETLTFDLGGPPRFVGFVGTDIDHVVLERPVPPGITFELLMDDVAYGRAAGTRGAAISGVVVSARTGAPVPFASLRGDAAAGAVHADADAAGRFTLVVPSGSPALARVTVGVASSRVAAGLSPAYVEHAIDLSAHDTRGGARVELIEDAPPFSAAFYRQLARDARDAPPGNRTLRPWTRAPSFYIQTTEVDTGAPVPDVIIRELELVIRNSVPELTGRRFVPGIVDSGPDPRPATEGWVNVLLQRVLPHPGAVAESTVGGNQGTLRLQFDPARPRLSPGTGTACSWTTRVALHAIVHTLGFYHADPPPGVDAQLHPPDACTGEHWPEIVRYHAALVYSRPVGNAHPDVDPPPGPGRAPDDQPTVVCTADAIAGRRD